MPDYPGLADPARVGQPVASAAPNPAGPDPGAVGAGDPASVVPGHEPVGDGRELVGSGRDPVGRGPDPGGAGDPALAGWPRAVAGEWSGWRRAIGSVWVLAGPEGSGAGEAEAARLRWLAGHLPCPAVVAVEGDWLVVQVPVGEPATRPERQPRPGDVPRLVGETLRRLHELPVTACPFERSWDEVVGGIAAAVAEERLDREALPEPYRRYEPARLLELVRQGRPPAVEADVVVCHGRPVAGHLFFEQGRLSGLAGVGRLGRADRHVDLAAAWRSLSGLFGPDALHGLAEGYGREPDLIRLDHHILLDVLLDAVVPRPGAPATPAGPAPTPAPLRPVP